MIASVNGVSLAYDDVGAGLPIVFLHAFPLDRSMWAPQVGALVRYGRCVAPDFRGLGGTTAAPPYSMDQYADDAAALLDALDAPPAIVVGLSMGGYVAFAMWRRHRRRIRALVLLDTRAGADSDETRAKRRAQIEVVRTQGPVVLAAQLLPGQLGERTRERHPEVVEQVRMMLASAPVDGIVGALEAMMARPDSASTLPTIDVPTLIVVGAEDAPTPPAEARAMHERIRGSRLEVLAGAGHVSNLEQPSAFNHVLTEFVEGVALG